MIGAQQLPWELIAFEQVRASRTYPNQVRISAMGCRANEMPVVKALIVDHTKISVNERSVALAVLSERYVSHQGQGPNC